MQTCKVHPQHVRDALGRDAWPEDLGDRTEPVEAEFLYERPLNGNVVRVYGHTVITVANLAEGPNNEEVT